MDKKLNKVKKQITINAAIMLIVGLALACCVSLYGEQMSKSKFFNSVESCNSETMNEFEYYECVNEMTIERTQSTMVAYISVNIAICLAVMTILSSVIYYRHSKLVLT